MAGLISALQGLVSIASLVLILACGTGFLVTFIVGWMKASQLRIQNVMIGWTACWLVGMLLGIFQAVAMRS